MIVLITIQILILIVLIILIVRNWFEYMKDKRQLHKINEEKGKI
ncbi:tellurite resistance protein TehA-like permease [Aquimarina sp. EL_43]|nr:tellurite resistance protein TehA-like permease [Aquimarina sp. EL_35]MBG6150022.1 tellurite resistance protein TehA-like permease [Aquimarina sp. EL_32]MBG6167291.1 tellurite resistance protein TehA-like permease [Aquimarina sp. EL_43]